MIKAVLFDLDGVLVCTKELHFKALNSALLKYAPAYVISEEEHHKVFDGKKTKEKLDVLSQRGMSDTLHDNIFISKQEETIKTVAEMEFYNPNIVEVFDSLRHLKTGVCSNSIKNTTKILVEKLHISPDVILSNDDVTNSKPHPEMYWNAMALLKCLPEETIIFEDSPVGLMAATRSGANVVRVNTPNDITSQFVNEKINYFNSLTAPKTKWKDSKLNILIPMAGAGSRFKEAGYVFPKPLIEIHGKPMIQMVVENLNVEGNFIFLVQEEHKSRYNLDALLKLIAPNCQIVYVDGVTQGAACTTLLAKELINNDNPLLIANSDQWLGWDSNSFFYTMNEQKVDGGIVTFEGIHPKWSFASVDEYGLVKEVAEKKPISNIASTGIYYYKQGRDYVKYAEQMIGKNIRTNNEFYVCPVFNEAIADGKRIKNFHIDEFYGTGTPDDLKYFISIK
jgi:HAD superfamily hydrolase (TIGR01509 family)